jgi:RNA polymerase sigma-B factor
MPAMATRTEGREPVATSRDQRARLLFQRYLEQRDPGTRETLFELFLPLARRLAGRHANGWVPFDDLAQVAGIGLLKAIERFDPGRGVPFAAFAMATMSGEIKRHYRDAQWSVHVPRQIKERALQVTRLRVELEAGSEAVAIEEIAAAAGLSEEQTRDALRAMTALRADSLDQIGEAGDELDARGVEERGYRQAEARHLLDSLMQQLDERDRTILHLRFVEDLTQDRIAKRLEISQMQVSRLIARAVATMRGEAARAGRASSLRSW